jgi:hypothetical protein
MMMRMMSLAVAGLLLLLFLALDLVLDCVRNRRASCSSQECLELGAMAHLVPDGAACTTADDRCHQALFAILGLSGLTAIV